MTTIISSISMSHEDYRYCRDRHISKTKMFKLGLDTIRNPQVQYSKQEVKKLLDIIANQKDELQYYKELYEKAKARLEQDAKKHIYKDEAEAEKCGISTQ